MLFRKKIARSCSYCQYGAGIGEGQILCIKRGVVLAESSCKKFRYAPCKRIPLKMKPLDFKKYEDADFTL